LKFYGISDKDLQTYQSYLGNRYCWTAKYKDSENSNKVSNWAKVRHGVPQGSILGPLLFLLYINDLPKIINKTSPPIIFADDTSILFTHSNLTDFNKNIYIVFTTLNKWLTANQLPLNFNKTNYVHFKTKRNTSVNLKIGFNNNFITNSSYTKFLGVIMNNTFSWNNHIDLLMKKLSKACYIIRNAKTYTSASSLKVIYYAFFTRLWAMELYFGETRRIAPRSLEYKKRQLELWKDVGIEFCVETYLRNYKFWLWHHNICYLYECV